MLKHKTLPEVAADMWNGLRATGQPQQIHVDDVVVSLERRRNQYVLTLMREVQEPTTKRVKLYRAAFGVPEHAKCIQNRTATKFVYVYSVSFVWEAT